MLEDSLAQYALKDEPTPVPRQFVDSGAASVVRDRFSVDTRYLSVDDCGVAGVVLRKEEKVEGSIEGRTTPTAQRGSKDEKDTEMTDDTQ